MKTAERKIAARDSTVAPDAAAPDAASPDSAPSGPTVEGTFTRYVRAIAARSDAVGEMAEELRVELRKVLVREMRWRSLWASSPAFVGILGWPSWTPGDTQGTASPLEDLLSDCYVFIFGHRLRQLLNQLKVQSRIDGLVVVYLRQFLTHLQKHHDPLGYRLFEVLCAATRGVVASGDLHVLHGTSKIRNETVLGVGPAQASPVSIEPASVEPVSVETLRPLVARWNGALLPDLITAERVARRQVTERLRDHLVGLASEGVSAFRFKDLLDALKADVRARWSGFRQQEEGEVGVEDDDDDARQLVWILQPETRIEDLDSFKKLVRCVSNLIPKADTRMKTRAYLERLWNFMRRWSIGDRDALPSHRELEGELEIPRDRFAGLYKTLGHLTRRCQGTLSGTVVEIESGRHHVGTSIGAVSPGDSDG